MTKTKYELAKEHAEWTAELVRKIYNDAFVHGYKHGEEAKE